MAPKAKKEAPSPPKAEAKAKALKANKHQIKQAIKKLYDIDVAKVNTLIRPDGEKKAYVQLATDYDALDDANKLGSSKQSPAV
ncbi:Hypothetical predicted protein [Marmota monax]|uniref:Ribosomal protein L23/L25 N-terminal domain-containing protein n=1 Tax=Marmota monax TaxID=9995 RepID=A0A5E4ABV2_MARMO|nr:Hypothetical predicted protein [Marmota monax]